MKTPVSLPWWLTTASRCLWRLPVRGRLRAIRWLVGLQSARREVQLITRDGLRVVIPSLEEPMGQELLAYGRYEGEVDEAIRRHLPTGGVFVDIGANIGLFAGRMAAVVGPAGRVVAVEASPDVFARLTATVLNNRLTNVTTLHAAVTDVLAVELPFWDAPQEKFGMGALAAQFDAPPSLVPARRLDDILSDARVDRVGVLKVDVEGFEAGVFRGAERLLTGQRPPAVVFEFIDWAETRAGLEPGESQRVLVGFGYTLHTLAGEPLDGPVTSGFANLLGIPRKR